MTELDIQNLRKVFDTPHGDEIAVDGVNLSIEDNDFITLVGPSGCGKTTTLRCVAGLESPTSGEIVLNGQEITELPPSKRDIAMMFQSIALYPHMIVRENIGYPLKVKGISEDERREPVEEAARIMQIEEMLDKHPGDLSGGQQQRAALARTVVQEPEVFLMDEPLSDLDAKLKVETRKEIQRIHKKIDKPIIYVTHDQEEAMTMSDRVAVLNDGQIEQFAPPEDLFKRPNNVFVGQFIGNHGMNVLDAEVRNSDGRGPTVTVENYEPDLIFGDDAPTIPSGDVRLGFRPENTAVKSSGDGIPGRIRLLETFGEQTLATIDLDVGRDEPINAVIDIDKNFEEGEQVKVTIDRTRTHLFDAESGETIAHTDKKVVAERI